MTDEGERLIAEMRVRLEAQPADPAFVTARAQRRHAAALAAGVRCPKGFGCSICDAHRAMAPRKDPKHPMFRDHNCAYCGSGEKPCKQDSPSQCEFPRARTD